MDDMNYQYLDYLINSGQFSPHFVFQQPYKLKEFDVADTNLMAGQWRYLFGDKHISFFAGMENSWFTSDNERLRLYQVNAGAHYCDDDLILGNRTTLDKKYKYDETFPGDLSESEDWLYGRVNDAYMDLTLDRFNLFIGRMKKNWGPVNSYGLILSSNPYNYDQVNFAYNTDFFRFSLIYARLEDANAGREFFGRDSSYAEYINVRKHITGHRVDVHFSDNFQIALTEMAIYGGEDRDFELAYANPMNFYYGIQRNQGKGMSGLWSLDLFYKPMPKLTLYGQFLIDDIIVNNDPEVKDRDRYPDRFAFNFSLRSADLLLTGLNTNLSYIKVWNDTYQSRRSWENYHYEGLGLGYPDVSCHEFHVDISYWNLYPFYFSNQITIGQYGNSDLYKIFTLEKREFPAKPVTDNVYNKFSFRYTPKNFIKVYLDYTFVKNKNHYLSRWNYMGRHNLELGLELLLAKGLFY
jgi:hypothetical protein